jgi:hypothetical protein
LRRRLFVVFVAFHIPAFHSLKQIKKSNTSQYTTWESATTGSGRGVALATETATTQTKTFSISGVIRSIPFPPSQPPLLFPTTNLPAEHWQQTYFAWQNRLHFEQERAKAVESHQLRVFGGEPGDEVSLFEPMMKVVTDLFDGYDDFGYP